VKHNIEKAMHQGFTTGNKNLLRMKTSILALIVAADEKNSLSPSKKRSKFGVVLICTAPNS